MGRVEDSFPYAGPGKFLSELAGAFFWFSIQLGLSGRLHDGTKIEVLLGGFGRLKAGILFIGKGEKEGADGAFY